MKNVKSRNQSTNNSKRKEENTMPREQSFKDSYGREHTERRGAYNPELTSALGREFRNVAIVGTGNIDGKSHMSAVLEVVTGLNDLDDNLCRMFDDKKAGRPVIEFDVDKFTETLTLITKMTECMENGQVMFSYKEKVAELMAFVVIRFIYIAKYAFYILRKEEIEEMELDAQMQMYSYNNEEPLGTIGEQIDGLSDEDRDAVLNLLNVECSMLKIHILADTYSDIEEKSLQTAEACHLLATAIMEGKGDELKRILDKVKDYGIDDEKCRQIVLNEISSMFEEA